jgi:hypothetical protein
MLSVREGWKADVELFGDPKWMVWVPLYESFHVAGIGELIKADLAQVTLLQAL